MLDLHTHVLPGLDDGAVDLAAGVALCRRLHEQGVTTVVATPHWHSPRFEVMAEGIGAAWDQLWDAVTTAVPGLALIMGAEHHLSGLEEPATFLASCRPLGDSTVVLVELPDDHLPANAWATLFALIRAGRRPVLAHPERCRGLRSQRDQLAAFVEAGGLLQLTLGHLLGVHGWRMRWHSRGFFRRFAPACLIASDCHDLGVRRPQWDRLPQAWRERVPRDLASVSSWGMTNNSRNV